MTSISLGTKTLIVFISASLMAIGSMTVPMGLPTWISPILAMIGVVGLTIQRMFNSNLPNSGNTQGEFQ